MIEALRDKIFDTLSDRSSRSDFFTINDRIICIQQENTSELSVMMYEPALCVVLQGAKLTSLDNRSLRLSAGDSVIISHHVPVYAKITQASTETPYLALIVKIDLKLIRDLHLEIEQTFESSDRALSVDSEKADTALIHTLDRFVTAVTDPLDAEIIGPSIYRELHVRMLRARHGGMLREMVPTDSAANSIARAIEHIRSSYRSRLLVADIAREVGMSESSFHQKFREITGTTPNQYQKTLRLIEAHSLLSLDGYSVSAAAFAVGYESANHFSRDYSRRFGIPPKEAKTVAA